MFAYLIKKLLDHIIYTKVQSRNIIEAVMTILFLEYEYNLHQLKLFLIHVFQSRVVGLSSYIAYLFISRGNNYNGIVLKKWRFVP